MSIIADDKGHESELEQSNKERLKVLKAILAGIALIANVTPKELMEMVEDK